MSADRPRPCPVCGAEAAGLLLSAPDRLASGGGDHSVLGCSGCGLAYTDPLPADPAAAYPSDSYYAYQAVPETLPERVRLWLVIRASYGAIARRPPGRLLDVGCGAGRLLAAFERRGWQGAGVEPSAAAARLAAERGLEVVRGTLEDAPWPPGSFDAVVFNHSLEHVPDPVSALRSAHELLVPGGLLGVSVPNFASWQRRLFGGAWFQLDLPRHLQHFEGRTLVGAAARAGFEPVETRSSSMLASLPGSVQYRLLGTTRLRGRTARLVAYALYPGVLLADRAGGGDCVTLVARRA